jgi:[acyl-carrier-protein] S-malonyltransferase
MKNTALLFTGQGAQTVGMGRDLCDKYPASRQVFARANEILGRDLQTICFEGPDDVLTQTDNAQPGIFVASLACWEALKAEVPDLKFGAMAGLSLGELTALTAAGAFTFEDGLRTVQVRGRFMQEACATTAGAMASIIGMDDALLEQVCRDADVDIANLNSPGQTVISGDKEKIARAVELAKTKGAKRALPLQVAGAYHSRLMVGAQRNFASLLETVPLCDTAVMVVSNVTARPTPSADETKKLLVRQVTSSVRWADSMRWLIEQGFTRFIELGPGTVLTGLMKRIDKNVQMLNVSNCASLTVTVAALR